MGMRGSDAASGALFSYVDMEARVPATHPLRTIRTIVNEVLAALDTEFEALYEGIGRQSVAPERLLRASLLQAFYSVRSERQLMEQINYNLLFRWFVGLGIDDAVWDHSTFSKNRERLLGADVAAKFLAGVLRHPKVTRFLSDEHFSVDGTLVEAWASLKSFHAKDGSDEPPAPGQPGCQALIFAFKGQGAVFYSAAADCADRGAHSRRQDPKTPVEQALMRGLGTA